MCSWTTTPAPATRRGVDHHPGTITAPSSTNTALWLKQQDDIDIDCGCIVAGLESVDQVGERNFRLMLDTASGRQTKREGHGCGQNEFVPWQLRAVM
ncbi:MAG: UxaA family hydrolase [Rubrivivax sp.]|nr:UxaA family hydrolase [Rubrivivax sp.]MBK7262859.1 UxaA family hydrolase [Rubrivivax sp.]MBK8528758.1 UxaA family hydrolase [Rubrivivax sp.]